jgi:hypothetical protein
MKAKKVTDLIVKERTLAGSGPSTGELGHIG